jgi:hypothetical protein
MSRLTMGIFGAIGLSLVSGAAQFALGHDMGHEPLWALRRDFLPAPALQTAQRRSLQTVATGAGSLLVNREAKSDRAARPPGQPTRTKTVALQPDGVSDTSYLLRIPDGDANSSRTPANKPGVRKPMVACEPMVSVLTEIANQLQPGRCVT